MSGNKQAKLRLIERYGKEDFLDRLGVKVFEEPVEYTGKAQYKRMKQLTYHHIKMKSKGGKATVENGALLTSEHHSWFHQQSKGVQAELNKKFQELKRKLDEGREVPVVEVDSVDLGFEVKGLVFNVEPVKKYDRTQFKKESRDLIKEYERGE